MKEIDERLREHSEWLREMRIYGHSDKKQADFSGEDLRGVMLVDANLRKAIFREANLTGARLFRCLCDGASFGEATMISATLNNCSFDDACLASVNMLEVTAVGSKFTNADLDKANLYNSNISLSNFRSAILTGASLDYVKATRASFEGAVCHGTTWENADLQGSNLQMAQFDSWVDLSTVGIVGVRGNNKEICSAYVYPFDVAWTKTTLAIGCEQLPISKWVKMTKKEAKSYGPQGMEFFTTHRETLLHLMKNHGK